jgi:hypothetical protein
MSIKDHALLVSLRVNKPQMTQKDDKATHDAEAANNAHGAGQFRKDLYPKGLVQPILAVESATRAYIESTTYMWTRGEYLLPTSRFMDFTERIAKFEVEFNQSVTAFLNNWSNVMMRAEQAQGDLFDASVYPDLSELKNDFRFRVVYRPVTDAYDFRVHMQEEELDLLRKQVQQATLESMESVLKEPLHRLRSVVAKLYEVASKPDRQVLDKKTGAMISRPPIFRDSVCENIAEEINLLHDFAQVLPDGVLAMAKVVADTTPHPQTLRDDPEARKEVNERTKALLDTIDSMLEA